MDALRFTHAAQMLLMYVNWPRDTAAYLGPDVPSLDGRWLFKGPRVCMAIHQTDEYEVRSRRRSQDMLHALARAGQTDRQLSWGTGTAQLLHNNQRRLWCQQRDGVTLQAG